MGAVLPGCVTGLPPGRVVSEAQSAVVIEVDSAALCLVSVVGPPLPFEDGDPASHSPSTGLGPGPADREEGLGSWVLAVC